MSNSILLSICIPTYNRSAELDICLQQFCKQVEPFKDIIEIIVSDNCSPDNTKDIVEKYLKSDLLISYYRQSENIGGDRNFEWCFSNATGKYCWLFGDDDLLLDNKLETIIAILQNREPVILYVKGYGFKDDYQKEVPVKKQIIKKADYREFTSKKKYIRNVHYNVTFASGNIINKKLLPANIDSTKFITTNLNYVYLILALLNKGEKFASINEYVMACKTNNTGGYKLFETFSTNFNRILTYMNEKEGMPKYISRIINFNLLLTFFPQFVLSARINSNKKFIEEDTRDILNKTYKKNIWFWIFVIPILSMPVQLSKAYQKHILNNINRVKNVFV